MAARNHCCRASGPEETSRPNSLAKRPLNLVSNVAMTSMTRAPALLRYCHYSRKIVTRTDPGNGCDGSRGDQAMCMNQRRFCECGQNSVFLSFRDNILPPEILLHLYCPHCRPPATGDKANMLEDCGWVLEYDLERAQAYFDRRGHLKRATPEYLFDEDYL